MITTKLFEEFQSCLEKSIQEIKEPINDYEKLLLEVNYFLENNLISVKFNDCFIETNEIITIIYGDDEGDNVFYFTYHHEYNKIVFLQRECNNGFSQWSNPAYEETSENIFKPKQSQNEDRNRN